VRQTELKPQFVESMLEDLDPGVLYISVRYRTAAHLCACGCGVRVVTPIKPARWKFSYNGETVSLWPSIGNWQKPCRSHYVIKDSQIIWRRAWSDEEITAGRERDQREIRRFYAGGVAEVNQPEPPTAEAARPGRLRRIIACFRIIG
jgi:hypothetical protein